MNEFTEIARKLGPERCRGALRAWEQDENDGWDDCALALAYGERCAFSDAAWKDPEPEVVCKEVEFAVRVFGLRVDEVGMVIQAFDGVMQGDREAKSRLRAALGAEAAKCAVRQMTEAV